VQFVGSRGWVVGTGQILGTLDGGTNWATQWQGSARLQAVDFVTATNGWAVGPGIVLATTDGGSHWSSLPEPTDGLNAIHFSSPSAGLGVSGGTDMGAGWTPACGGKLVQTSDGGRTWAPVAGSPRTVESACSSGPDNTWVAAAVGNKPHLFLRSANGTTWTDEFTPPFRHGTETPLWVQLECSNTAVWAYFTGGGAAMMHSGYFAYRLSGSTATPLLEESYIESLALPPDIPNGPGDEPGPFSVVSDDLAVFSAFSPATTFPASTAAAGPGVSRLTVLGRFARIWQPTGLSFSDALHGWATGDGISPSQGTAFWDIESTVDGGRHWTLQLSERAP
jgi:hypothetical protein